MFSSDLSSCFAPMDSLYFVLLNISLERSNVDHCLCLRSLCPYASVCLSISRFTLLLRSYGQFALVLFFWTFLFIFIPISFCFSVCVESVPRSVYLFHSPVNLLLRSYEQFVLVSFLLDISLERSTAGTCLCPCSAAGRLRSDLPEPNKL